MSDRPRTEATSLEEANEARNLISTYWVEHYSHLSPEGNRMGGGAIDPERGVVCNCGEVLGHPPAPEDPEEYLAQTADEATPDEAAWNDLMAAGDAYAPEVAEVMDMPPYKVGDKVTVGGIEFTKHSESPFPEHNAQQALTEANTPPGPDDPPWDTSDGPGLTKLDNYREQYADARAEMGITGDPVGDDPADEHAARTEAVVDLPPMPEDDRNDMYAASAKGTLPVRAGNSGIIPQDPLSARVVTIDPSKPYGPADVELQLLEVENKLERGMHWQRYWEERSAAADMEWEIVYNKARAAVISYGGSEKDRHARCLQVPGVELAFREQKLASAMVRMARESMHTLRSLQSGYQTITRSVENSYRGRQPGA